MAKKISKDDLIVHGKIFIGKVVRIRLQKNALVEWERRIYVPKYERYQKHRTRIMAHIPSGIKISEGDIVEIGETRKISKTKNFIVMKKIEGGNN